jgi:hypothetical protein
MHLSRSRVLLALLAVAKGLPAQQSDSTSAPRLTFRGAASITQNGFSLIPSFSLGAPAAVVTLAVGGKRFSYEPEFRFALEGLKPWSILNIWRYKLVARERLSVTAGAHLPVYAFRTVAVEANGTSSDLRVAQRFLPFELGTSYAITPALSVGTYYLYSRGLEKVNQPRNTNFAALRGGVSGRLGEQGFLRLNPQMFYLRSDARDGFYVANTVSIGRRGFPLSVSSIVNKALRSDIVAKDFDWNVSVVYSVNKELVAR